VLVLVDVLVDVLVVGGGGGGVVEQQILLITSVKTKFGNFGQQSYNDKSHMLYISILTFLLYRFMLSF
jgi:hypothetical protein